jgi:Tol biopolymer transport system component
MTRHSIVLTLLVFAATLGVAPAASAQYFGQNKVQYEKFDFKILKTEHFDIYYYPEEEEATKLAARMAERWYARLSKVLGHELSSRQPLILYAAHPHFQQTNVLDGDIGEGTGGVTESARRRIILPFAGGLAETDHVLGHELVHAFQYDIGNQNSRSPETSALNALPLWFIEGMAEYLSLGPIDAQTAMWVRDASWREKMPSIDKLSDPRFFPYRYGHAFWAFVGGHWGDKAVSDMLFATANGASIDTALQTVLNVDKKTFTMMWHDDTRRMYASYFEATQPASKFGRPLITKETGGGDMNVSPSISPDGKRVVFLSERSLFAIDMYVADVSTGKVTRTLVKTEGDAHFDSLQFIDSAGDWAPDNHRFVFAALEKGKPVLTLIDVDNGKREAEYPFPDLDQIFNPAWSPDGHRIAFTALHGGLLDLYMYDVTSHQTTQLTNDMFADYDPEWSPDGKSLAWVTDRFNANPDALQFGGYRIGLMDVDTKDAKQIAGFSTGINTNPEFSADGQTLFFIGEPDGIPNVYRVNLSGGTPVQVTNVLAGINGITPLTPSLTISSKADVMIFTAFEDNNYNVYVTNQASQASTRGASIARNGAALPPEDRSHSEVLAYLKAPEKGLPGSNATYNPEDYKPKFGLEAIAQPTVGVGVDRFGAFAAGGLGMMFRDTLGNHELDTVLQISSRFQEIGGAVMYLNKTHRWNWGLIGEQTPYVTGSFSQNVALTSSGQPVLVEQELRQTETNSAVTGLIQYPFSRAHRVEVSGGYRHIGFGNHLETRLYDLNSGQQIDTQKTDLPSEQSLSLGEASGALVYDTAIFGATSPILGQRYRLELTQSSGSLLYSGVLLDYRKYFMPVRPFTIALRGMHYGRYGRDGEDPRLSPVDLGYPGLVRGYDFGSFGASECGVGPTCPVADQLVGSRIAVGNAELRFPLVGAFSRRTFYGPLPIEIALFTDAGMAWTTTATPQLFHSGDRPWVKSAGAAIRFSVFGYMVGEIDYVKPFDRPDKGWYWAFNFIPGF